LARGAKSESLFLRGQRYVRDFPVYASKDKELFTSFIRSLPRKDNYYLLVDVHNDQAIDRWMERVESGQTIGVVALERGQMIGFIAISKPTICRGPAMSGKFA
jgi:hypothetical protein